MTAPKWLQEVDWEQVQAEALDFLQRLLRIDTTNPPGNELAACQLIAEVLEEEGIPHELFEVAPGRANLVARIEGDGGGEPVLLSAHLDVVEADDEAWTYPPFGGEIHEGCVWGRGAIDMKNMAAMELACVLAVKRHVGSKIGRDLIFAAVADEEAGCELGSLWLARHHPQKVRAGIAIGEVGGFTVHVGDTRIVPVQVAEKGVCWLKITASGEGGHGSMPIGDSAIGRIGEAAQRLARTDLPMHVTPVVRHFVEQLASHQPAVKGIVLKRLLQPWSSDWILDHVIPDAEQAQLFRVLLRNTAAPTVLQAGSKVNVIPTAAELKVDGRTLPGQDDEAFLAEVRAVIGEGFEVEIERSLPPVEGRVDDPVLAVIQEVIDQLDPGAVVIPNTITGFTDAKAWSSLGSRCIGFSPIRLGPELPFKKMFHGVDERIPVDGFQFGVRALVETVARILD